MANTISTSTNALATAYTPSRHVAISASGDMLVIWFDGSNVKWSYASSPYSSWTTATLAATIGGGPRYQVGLYKLSNDDVIVVTSNSSGNIVSYYMTYSSAGHSWSAGSPVSVLASGASYNGGDIAMDQDAQGRVWAAWQNNSNTLQVYYTANSGTSWSVSTTIATSAASYYYVHLAYAGNYIVALYFDGGDVYRYTRADAHDVAIGSWSTPATPANNTLNDWSGNYATFFGVPGSDHAVLVYDGGTMPAQYYTASTNTWSALTNIGATNDQKPTLVTDGTNLYCLWCKYTAANNFSLVYKKWTTSTHAWDGAATQLEANGTNIQWASAGYGGSTLGFVYTVGTASPWTVYADTLALGGPTTYTRPITGVSTATQALGVERPVTGVSVATQAFGVERPVTGISAAIGSPARDVTGISAAVTALGIARSVRGIHASVQALQAVSTSTVAYATRQTTGQLVFIASDGTACVLWCDGTNQVISYAAPPYASWTKVTHTTGLNMVLGGKFRAGTDNIDTATGGTSNVRGNYTLLTKSGATWTVGTRNTLSGTTAIGVTAQGSPQNYIGQDAQGRHWVAVPGATNTATTCYYSAANSPTTTGWTASGAVTQTADLFTPAADQVGNYLVYIYWNGTALQWKRVDNSASSVGSWTTAATIANLTGSPNASSAVKFRAISATQGLLTYSSGSGIYAQIYTAASDTFGTATQLSSTANDQHPTIATDGAGNAWVVWCSYVASNNFALVFKKYNGTWDTDPTTLLASGTNITYPNAGYGTITSDKKLGVIYTQGTGSPYTVGWLSLDPISHEACDVSGVSAAVQALGVERPVTGVSVATQALGIERPITGITADVAIPVTTYTRPVTGVSVATQALGVERPVTGVSVATQAFGVERPVTGVSSAVQALGLTRPVTSVSTSLLFTGTRPITSVSSAVQALGITRPITTVTAATQALGIERPITTITSAVKALGVERPITSITAAVLQPGITCPITGVTAALSGSLTRPITGVTGAVQALGIERPITGVTTSASLNYTRPVTGVTAATQALGLERPVTGITTSVAVSHERPITGVTSALIGLGIERPITGVTGAVGIGGITRDITGVSVAIKQLGITRDISNVSSAVIQVGIIRPITDISSSVAATHTRSITGISSALKAFGVERASIGVSTALKAFGVERPVTSVTSAVGQGGISRDVTGISTALQAFGVSRPITDISSAVQAVGVTRPITSVTGAVQALGIQRPISSISTSLAQTVTRPLTNITSSIQATVSRPIINISSSVILRNERAVTGISGAVKALGVSRTITGIIAGIGVAGISRSITGVRAAICLPVTLSYRQVIVSSPRGLSEVVSPRGTIEVVSPKGTIEIQEE